MKLREIISEAYVLPKLQNQDPYKQYRFGVALASKGSTGFSARSVWGENQIVDPYTDEEIAAIDDALRAVGLKSSDKKKVPASALMITNPNSRSPVAKIKRNKYGV